jgi:hypothetical protein
VRAQGLTRWQQIESEVVALLSSGSLAGSESLASSINDVMAQLVENAAGRKVGRHVSCGSTLLANVDIDLCYPPDGSVPVVGAMVNVCNPGRPGQEPATSYRDAFRARVQQAAWMSLDFKLQYAPVGHVDSVGSWVKETTPRFYTLWIVHCANDAEFVEFRATLNALRSHCNRVGALFLSSDSGHSDRCVALTAGELQIDRVLREVVAGVVRAEQ